MTAQAYVPPFSRSDPSPIAQWFWTVDRGLLAAALALMAIGVTLSFAASPAAILAEDGITDPFHYALRMIVFVSLGLTAMVGASFLTPRGVRRIAVLALLCAIIVMALLPFIGHEAKGASRWINLGPFGLQPSEFAKPAVIVFSAWMFAEGQKGQGVPGVTVAFVAYAATVGLLLLQPDIGQTLLITTTFMAVFFMIGVPLRWMAVLGSLVTAGVFGLYFAFDHVRSRVATFVTPGVEDTYQIDRASEAIRAGGLVGRGVGEGVMKRNVPDLHTDFIYSVGAEEFGLMLSLLIIGLYAFIVVRGLSRALRLVDPFEQTAAAGLFMLIGLQACINVAVNLNVIPTKGMTLPFISYGGSSMLAMGLTMGLALALTRKRPGAFLPGGSGLLWPGAALLKRASA
jgi:cell division protein FtsW